MTYQATSPGIVRRRRRYTRQFKDQILTECRAPGTSVAQVALRHGLNLNLVHKWRKAMGGGAQDAFLRLPLPAAVPPVPGSTGAHPVPTLRIDVCAARGQITVHWPIDHVDRLAVWLKALMQ